MGDHDDVHLESAVVVEVEGVEMNLRISDVPIKLLKRFCSEEKLGIGHSSMDKARLVSTLASVPNAESRVQKWLAKRGPQLGYEVVSLEGGGRRITETYADGTKRIFTENKHGAQVAYEQPKTRVEDTQRLAVGARQRMVGRKYIHYKGMVYRVIEVAVDESTLEVVVIYERDGWRWTRTLADFDDEVLTENRGRVRRFQEVK